MLITINGLHLQFAFSEAEPVKLLDMALESCAPSLEKVNDFSRWARLVEIQASGFNHNDHHGNKYSGTEPGGSLRYVEHKRIECVAGPKLEIMQRGGGLEVVSHLQFLGELPVFRAWTTVENIGTEDVLLEYVSTFALAGVSRGGSNSWDRKMLLHVPDNSWCGECQWRSGDPQSFGLSKIYPPQSGSGFGLNRISISSQGTWSTLGYLPIGVLENTETDQSYFWQIEHNGSWQWEVADLAYELYLRVSGPTYREGLWSKCLRPGQVFGSVPATIGRVPGGLQSALRMLTKARRILRKPHGDMEAMPVIFNDYMNCLMGDPTTEKLVPIVDFAAKVGSEYFVIDAGWYAHRGENWWGSVGEWQASETRFPGGLREITERIRAKGMVPGLWLEIEVMGIHCPLADRVPDSWFFQRAGRRVADHGRYQLDFRNPEVTAHAGGVIDRLVSEYGIGYIKMDYNINAGPGTDVSSDSPGDGLLEHNRAYLRWIEGVMERHPHLVIENCSSGGLRMDYAQLAVHPIQSVSDQTDYRLNGIIAAACASAVTPEQAAVWSYPLKEGGEEETIFNMVNALLLRVHQSGRLHEISRERLSLVKEGINLYKSIRSKIRSGLPFWPTGLPRFGDDWTSFGLDCDDAGSYLAVWRFSGESAELKLSLPQFVGIKVAAVCIYPANREVLCEWNESDGMLRVYLPEAFTARLFKIQPV